MRFKDYDVRWSKLVGRPLNRFEQMLIARPFHYSTLTEKWTRLLKPVLPGSPFGYVEMDLTLNEVTGKYPLTISVHCRAPDKTDKFLSSLPDEDIKRMTERLGNDFPKWVLFSDLWSDIDDVKLPYVAARYAPFSAPLLDVLRPERRFTPTLA